MNRLFFNVFWVCVASVLVACGGGGGGGAATGSTSTPNVNQAAPTYPLRTAFANLLTSPGTYDFSISTTTNVGLTKEIGSGSMTLGPLSPETIGAGISVQKLTINIVTTLKPTIPDQLITGYMLGDMPYGSYAQNDYAEYIYDQPIPASIKAGDSGPLYTTLHWTNPDKMTMVPRVEVNRYSLTAETATAALLKIISASTQDNKLFYTNTELVRVKPDGSVTLISRTTLYSDGTTVTINFKDATGQ